MRIERAFCWHPLYLGSDKPLQAQTARMSTDMVSSIRYFPVILERSYLQKSRPKLLRSWSFGAPGSTDECRDKKPLGEEAATSDVM